MKTAKEMIEEVAAGVSVTAALSEAAPASAAAVKKNYDKSIADVKRAIETAMAAVAGAEKSAVGLGDIGKETDDKNMQKQGREAVDTVVIVRATLERALRKLEGKD